MSAHEREGGQASADAGPTAAEIFDPEAFARRLAEARERRAEAFARRSPGGADLPPKPGRLPAEGSLPPRAPVPAPPAPGASWLRRLLARLGRRPVAMFGLGLGSGVAAALLAAQVASWPARAAPDAGVVAAALPAPAASPRPALPVAAAHSPRPPLPGPAPELRVAALPTQPPPRPFARPADLPRVAAAPAATRRATMAARNSPQGSRAAPQLPDRIADILLQGARAAARELDRLGPRRERGRR